MEARGCESAQSDQHNKHVEKRLKLSEVLHFWYER